MGVQPKSHADPGHTAADAHGDQGLAPVIRFPLRAAHLVVGARESRRVAVGGSVPDGVMAATDLPTRRRARHRKHLITAPADAMPDQTPRVEYWAAGTDVFVEVHGRFHLRVRPRGPADDGALDITLHVALPDDPPPWLASGHVTGRIEWTHPQDESDWMLTTTTTRTGAAGQRFHWPVDPRNPGFTWQSRVTWRPLDCAAAAVLGQVVLEIVPAGPAGLHQPVHVVRLPVIGNHLAARDEERGSGSFVPHALIGTDQDASPLQPIQFSPKGWSHWPCVLEPRPPAQ